MRHAFASHHVEGIEAPPNYSVLLAPRGERRSRSSGLNMLYQSSSVAVRSRRRDRVLYGLAAHLSARVGAPADLVRTSAAAVIRGDRAILLPRQVLLSVKLFQPRLHRAGFQFVDVPFATIDMTTAELVVEPPAIEFDTEILDGLVGDSVGAEPPRVPAGRYPIRAWAFVAGQDDPGVVSRAKGVVATKPIVDEDALGLQGTLEALGELFRSVVPVAVNFSRPQDLIDQLRAAAVLDRG